MKLEKFRVGLARGRDPVDRCILNDAEGRAAYPSPYHSGGSEKLRCIDIHACLPAFPDGEALNDIPTLFHEPPRSVPQFHRFESRTPESRHLFQLPVLVTPLLRSVGLLLLPLSHRLSDLNLSIE